MAGNLELAGVIDCNAEDSGERSLVLAGLNYALRFLDGRQKAVDDKLRWARERTDWLDVDAAASGAVKLADGTTAAFLAADRESPLATQFMNLIDTRRAVERFIVLSPYWHDDLSALKFLQRTLRPDRTIILIDTEREMFPAAALPKGISIQVSELQGFDKTHFPEGNNRFIHAKMIVVTAGGMDHVLFGSANCTFAGLGNARRAGINEEACLYRRLPEGKIITDLGLSPLLDRRRAIDVRRISPPVSHDNLDVNEASENDPGVFELIFESDLRQGQRAIQHSPPQLRQ